MKERHSHQPGVPRDAADPAPPVHPHRPPDPALGRPKAGPDPLGAAA